MNDRPIRLTVVLTHPVQYFAAWFRHIARSCPAIDLIVLYGTEPTPEQQGVGFDAAFTWDVPLHDGYQSRVLRPPDDRQSVRSDAFRGVDVPDIGAAIRQTRPDVVLVMGWHSITYIRAIRACRRARIPLLFWGDTHWGAAPRGWRWPLWYVKSWILLRTFAAYLSVGRRTREYLLKFGISPTRIFATPHAVDNEFFAATAKPYQERAARAAARRTFGFAPDDFVVLFAGKLEAKKRPLDLVRAVAEMPPGARLLVAGSGPLEEECRQEAARRGVKATFAGFLNQSEIAKAYAVADCLALPSDWGETWGLVVNEAMATGLPCVLSDRVGCVPNLMGPGTTGECFAFGDVDALRGALNRLRQQLASGIDFAAACRARVARTSHVEAAEGLLAACESVVDPRIRVIALCGQMAFVSGMERMTFEALRVAREQGGAVHLIVNTWANWDRPLEPHPIAELGERLGATWSTGYYRERFNRRERNPWRIARTMWDVVCTSGGLMKDAAAFRPTHILVPEFLVALRNAPALFVLKLLGVRVILRLGNVAAAGKLYRRLWRYAVNPVVTQLVCNSAYTQQTLLSHGIRSTKTTVILNTVPTRAAAMTPGAARRDRRKIVYVGQILPEKGIDLVVDALALLVSRGIDATLDVVGRVDGWINPMHRPFHAALRERAARPDVADRIRFLGWRDDVPQLLASGGVHCCPSREPEGFGLVVIEAKQAATPSVVTSRGALPALVEHMTTGWVCPAATAASIAEGLAYFLEDAERQARAGEAAHASLEAFSRERFAANWLTVFAGGLTHDRSERADGAGDGGRRVSRRAPDPYAAGLAAGPRHRAR